jgi:DNA-binding SARP family transcriptional activator
LAHLGVLERALDDLGDPAFDDLYEYIEHNVFLPASRSQCLALLLGENRFCELPLIRGAIEARHAGELQAVRLHRARSAARRSAYVQAARYFMAAGNAGEAAGCLVKCTAAQRDDALAASLPFESLRHHPDLWLNSCDIRLEQIGAEAFASEAAAIAAILEATPDGAAHARRLREKLAAPIAARSGEPEHITDRAAEGRLRIELFDGKAVLGERNVQLTQREEAVLFTLAAARGRALDAQRLAKTIWPELDAAQGRAALKVAVSRLRARLENTAFVRFKDGKYMLDQAAAVDLEDVARALAAYERTGDAREIAALEPLLAAYRPTRLRDALWFAGIESELVRCSHRLAEHFAEIAIARRDPRALRHVGNALLAADACDEEGCKIIVHSHLLEGRADVARSEYDRFAERLRLELGCEPSFSFDSLPRPVYV